MKGSLSVNHPAVRKTINNLFLSVSGGRNRFRITTPYPLFPEVRDLENSFDQLKLEVDALVAERNLPRYGDIDPIRAAEVSQGWRLYYAYMLGVANPKAYSDVPTLVSFAERTPCVVNAMIAILDPGVTLKPHEGPYAGILRYHLALKVPEHNPPRLRVDQDYHTWQERGSILIDDTFEHEVYNDSDGQRILVIIDIRRPMNAVADGVNRLSLRLKRKWSDHFINHTNGDI